MSNEDIKSVIENMTCPIHGNRPSVSIEGGSIIYEACCDDFANIINRRIDDIMGGLGNFGEDGSSVTI